jgi:hypothetical protein
MDLSYGFDVKREGVNKIVWRKNIKQGYSTIVLFVLDIQLFPNVSPLREAIKYLFHLTGTIKQFQYLPL